jgi:hypothetical protein
MAKTASSSAERIPSNATTRPLITDVARDETQDAVAASPLPCPATVPGQQGDQGR